LPVDFIVADKFDENAECASATLEAGIPDEWMGLDIGPKSIELLLEPIKKAKLIVWNGYVDIRNMYCGSEYTVCS
jgi:phosphoglycerate kinase